ncbi:MAG TPA: patatin-like phospholipase family protein [Acidimicrobiales bacterium]|nr:patatin-like phospholipase family protein [Acidimicrobiales bacterium]
MGEGAAEPSPLPAPLPKLGLVLGAGGLVGLAYHAGVLRALERVGGVVPNDADLIVGSSAGSVVGAYLRSGMPIEEFWQLVTGPRLQTRLQVWDPMFLGPFEFGRRMLGSSYVAARSIIRIPTPRLPMVIQRLFPAGMFSMEEGRRRLRSELPDEWPRRPLWLCAVDVSSGRRVVLGREDPHLRTGRVRLPDAVVASCAIPGVYRPVRVGQMTLIDGGVSSTSNLDLAVDGGCQLIIGVVPMAFDTSNPPDWVQQLLRRLPARALAREAADARPQGSSVLLFRPTRLDLRLHGLDLMRPDGLDQVAQAAYESAARLLDTERFTTALAARQGPAAA